MTLPGIAVEGRIATVREYRRLRSTVPEEAKYEAALTRSLFGVVAVRDGVVIGMGRIVGDGALYATIVDVVVSQRFQRLGAGRKIVDRLLEWAARSEIATMGVVADPPVVGFYSRWSFQSGGYYLRLPVSTGGS